MAARDIPLTFACEWDAGWVRPWAKIDNIAAMYRMTRYLLGIGHHSLGIVTGPALNQHTMLRTHGFP
jgi:DNA-binding LacI/PurR family transcriptional regulator